MFFHGPKFSQILLNVMHRSMFVCPAEYFKSLKYCGYVLLAKMLNGGKNWSHSAIYIRWWESQLLHISYFKLLIFVLDVLQNFVPQSFLLTAGPCYICM